MWRKPHRPIRTPPRPVAHVEVGHDADPPTPEPTGPPPPPFAPAFTLTPRLVPLVIDQALDRVRTGYRVLLVDDRAERRSVLRTLVQTGADEGTVVAEAASDTAAVAAVRGGTVDAAVVEIQMPVAVGLAVIAALRAERPELVVVVCSFLADPATRREASEAGADAYLTKPVSAKELLLACRLPRREQVQIA